MTAGMPMMAIVGSGAPIDTKRLHELGFGDHVCKPFQQREMQIRLSKYCLYARRSAHKSLAAPIGTPALVQRLRKPRRRRSTRPRWHA
jgi:DNA-binding response OmpR family regulator